MIKISWVGIAVVGVFVILSLVLSYFSLVTPRSTEIRVKTVTQYPCNDSLKCAGTDQTSEVEYEAFGWPMQSLVKENLGLGGYFASLTGDYSDDGIGDRDNQAVVINISTSVAIAAFLAYIPAKQYLKASKQQ